MKPFFCCASNVEHYVEDNNRSGVSADGATGRSSGSASLLSSHADNDDKSKRMSDDDEIQRNGTDNTKEEEDDDDLQHNEKIMKEVRLDTSKQNNESPSSETIFQHAAPPESESTAPNGEGESQIGLQPVEDEGACVQPHEESTKTTKTNDTGTITSTDDEEEEDVNSSLLLMLTGIEDELTRIEEEEEDFDEEDEDAAHLNESESIHADGEQDPVMADAPSSPNERKVRFEDVDDAVPPPSQKREDSLFTASSPEEAAAVSFGEAEDASNRAVVVMKALPGSPTAVVNNKKKKNIKKRFISPRRRRREGAGTLGAKDFWQTLLGILTLQYFIEVFQHHREKKKQAAITVQPTNNKTTIAVGSF